MAHRSRRRRIIVGCWNRHPDRRYGAYRWRHRADTLDYTNSGGSLSLLNPSSVAGTFTLDTAATAGNPFAVSILDGDFTLNGGADAIAGNVPQPKQHKLTSGIRFNHYRHNDQ